MTDTRNAHHVDGWLCVFDLVACRPEFIETSPRYAVNGQPDTNPALVAVQNIIASVYLPKGVDDAGGWLPHDVAAQPWLSSVADGPPSGGGGGGIACKHTVHVTPCHNCTTAAAAAAWLLLPGALITAALYGVERTIQR